MTGKTITGKGFGGCIDYALFGSKDNVKRDKAGNKIPRGRIIGGTMAGYNKAGLMLEFRVANNLRPNKEKPLAHHILTFAPEDETRLDDFLMSEIGAEYMRAKGYSENAVYTIVKHADTDNTHLHIIASTTEIDGRHVWLARAKDIKICRELEKKHELRKLSEKPHLQEIEKDHRKSPNREEIAYTERTGNRTVREEIQNGVDKALSSPTVQGFIEDLQADGIFVKANIQTTGRVSGISFAKISPEGKLIALKGSDLGRGYTWTNLAKKLNYDSETGLEILRDAADEAGKAGGNRTGMESTPAPSVSLEEGAPQIPEETVGKALSRTPIANERNGDGRPPEVGTEISSALLPMAINRPAESDDIQASQKEKFVGRNTERRLSVSLGRELMCEAEDHDARFALNEFDRTVREQMFTVTISTEKNPKTRQTSISAMKRELKASAQAAVENDRKAGFLKMIAEDERISIAAAAKRRFEKAMTIGVTYQTPWVQAINAAATKKRSILAEKAKRADRRLVKRGKQTEMLGKRSSERSGSDLIKPFLEPEQIWKEQIRAAKRNDVIFFNRLEKESRAMNLPRNDDAYSRLRGIEFLSLIKSRLKEKEMGFGPQLDKPFIVRLRADASGNVSVLDDHANRHSKRVPRENERPRLPTHSLANKIDPLSSAAGNLSLWTGKASNQMTGSNPLEIIGNDPSVKIIRAAVKYFEEPSNALAFDTITRIASRQSGSLSPFPNRDIGSMEAARHMADSLRGAVNHEETLRSLLRKELGHSKESCAVPDRSFTNPEMKYIGETAAKLGDAALLDKYYDLVESDPDLARTVVTTQDRIAADALISQARAANICTQAIEKITFTENGGMEVVINPARFIEAKEQLEITDITIGFRNRIGVDESTPRLTFEDIEDLSQLTAPLYVQQDMSDYLNRQYIELGEQANRKTHPQLSENEKTNLNQLALPSSVIERFEQIRQSEIVNDQAYLLANASQANLPVQVPMRNFTTINPSDLQDQEDADFWKNERITREAQRDLERSHIVSTEESMLASDVESDEEEIADISDPFEATQEGTSQ